MNLFFDTLIFLFLFSTIVLALAVFRSRKRIGTWESRHKIISICLIVFLFFCFIVVVWGSFVEPRLVVVNRVDIDLLNFEPTQPVKAVLISDAHVGAYKKGGWIKKISSRIIELNPDLVFIAGDMIVSKSNEAKYLSPFTILNPISVYAVLGDHDYEVKKKPFFSINEQTAQVVRDALQSAGIKVLSNQTEVIEKYDARFILVGLDDWLAKKTQFPSLSDENLPVVAIIHNPDFILSPESKKVDLILAGNTHGGQIRLPFIGPVPALPTKLPRAYDEGLFTLENNNYLFITSGISESGPRARLFNPPEIVLLELR